MKFKNMSTTTNEIARQLHVSRPDWVDPGVNVAMEEINDHTVGVAIIHDPSQEPHRRLCIVSYDTDDDLYRVRITKGAETAAHTGLYSDTMTELVWGPEAKSEKAAPQMGFIEIEE